MENWPAPVTERVMGFMSTRDICSLARTSKKMNSSCSGNEFWRQLYSTTFHVPVATLPAQPQQGTGAGAASWKAAFLRQHALLRHVDACRRKVVPRDGWTDLESLIAEAVGLELDDVLQHALVAVSKRAAGQEAPIRRAAVRALITAAAKNKPSMLQKLIALFPNSPAFHDEDGTTALHSATSREIALMLLKGGASPLAVISGSFAAPIHTAAAAGNVEVVRCLLDSASINLKTSSGDTALNVACFHGSLAVVRLLANVGADLKLANNEGMLPLHCAAANNHVEVVRYLLSRGCQPGVADNHGNSPMDLCAARNHLSLIELFLEKANKLFTPEKVKSLKMAKIGSGAFGDVFRATLDGKAVAVKQVRSKALLEAGKTPEWIRQKFLVEVALMNKLGTNPNFVGFTGACTVAPDDYWIILEFLPGGSLFDLVHGVRPCASPPSVNGIARGIVDGMAHLHSRVPQILHRDLTSANVLLDSSGNPRIADFGISRFKLELGDVTMTYIGNPRWRAPEVTRGEHYSSSVDVYAFGMIIWELVSGKLPFQELDGALACLEAAKGKRPEMPPGCPQGWADLIRACWDHDPSRRPSFEAIRPVINTLPPLRITVGKPTMELANFESY